jgi:hypothetical protein
MAQALSGDVRDLGRRGDADEQHLSISPFCMTSESWAPEALPDVDLLGSLPSADDVVVATPLDVRRVVVIQGCWRRMNESFPLEELAEIPYRT